MKTAGYQNYKEQSVATMTQGELLLLLYEELQKRLLHAKMALSQQDYALFDRSIKRCNEIVSYLVSTLNFRYPISNELKRMYDFWKLMLARIEAGRHPEQIDDLKELVSEMHGAFAEAERLTRR